MKNENEEPKELTLADLAQVRGGLGGPLAGKKVKAKVEGPSKSEGDGTGGDPIEPL